MPIYLCGDSDSDILWLKYYLNTVFVGDFGGYIVIMQNNPQNRAKKLTNRLWFAIII